MGLASAKPINSRIREDITIVKAIATAKQWVSLRSTHTIRCDENVAYGAWPCKNDQGHSAAFRHVRGHGNVSRNRPWCRKGLSGACKAQPASPRCRLLKRCPAERAPTSRAGALLRADCFYVQQGCRCAHRRRSPRLLPVSAEQRGAHPLAQ
jgi:hypothetical protein